VGDIRYKPLYSCVSCREDYSKNAEDMRLLPNGDLICQDCYEQDDPIEGAEGCVVFFDALTPFVPEADQEIASLRAEVRLLRTHHAPNCSIIHADDACNCNVSRADDLAAEVGRLEKGMMTDCRWLCAYVGLGDRHPVGDNPRVVIEKDVLPAIESLRSRLTAAEKERDEAQDKLALFECDCGEKHSLIAHCVKCYDAAESANAKLRTLLARCKEQIDAATFINTDSEAMAQLCGDLDAALSGDATTGEEAGGGEECTTCGGAGLLEPDVSACPDCGGTGETDEEVAGE
jgi:hypothetical protein